MDIFSSHLNTNGSFRTILANFLKKQVLSPILSGIIIVIFTKYLVNMQANDTNGS